MLFSHGHVTHTIHTLLQDQKLGVWRCATLTWGNPTLPSPLIRFTSEFEMGSGGTVSLLSPDKKGQFRKADINTSFSSFLRRQEPPKQLGMRTSIDKGNLDAWVVPPSVMPKDLPACAGMTVGLFTLSFPLHLYLKSKNHYSI